MSRGGALHFEEIGLDFALSPLLARRIEMTYVYTRPISEVPFYTMCAGVHNSRNVMICVVAVDELTTSFRWTSQRKKKEDDVRPYIRSGVFE